MDSLIPHPVQFPQEMVGIWNVIFANGVARVYEIGADGILSFNGESLKIDADKIENVFLVKLVKMNQMERWTFRHSTLSIENWGDAGTYPNQNPSQTGTATLAK